MTDDIRPAIDYSSKDFAGFRRVMLDAKRSRVPEWTSESPSDLGVTIIEAVAYVGDILSFYGDRIANEAFLGTATSRRAVLDIARMLDYRPTGVTAASAEVEFTAQSGAGLIEIPSGTMVTTSSYRAVTAGDEPVVFETLEDVTFHTDDTLVATVTVVEGRTISGERVGTSDGSIDQRFRLFQGPVIHDSPRVFVEEGVGPVEWTYFDRLIDARSNQNAFTTVEDEEQGITIVFGDGFNGRVPPDGSMIEATYRVGGGERGNVGEGTLTELPSSIPGVVGVTNFLPATGGAEAESLNQIRQNAPRALSALTRAVSLADYANLAINVPGIAKARATAPAFNTVVIFAAPFGAGPTSTVKKQEIAEYLEDKKLTTTSVLIEDPTYVEVDISVSAHAPEEYNRTSVRRNVEAALVDLLRFDSVDFGFLVAISHVYDVINGVEGVEHATVTLLDRSGGTGASNVQLDPFEIPLVGDIDVTMSGGIPGS